MDCTAIKLTRKKFTKEEDDLIYKMFHDDPEPNWENYKFLLPNRTERRCKERFFNYLSPQLNKNDWTKEEDKLLKRKVFEYGYKWVKIVPFFSNRSASNIKNRWYRHVIKGIDPSILQKKVFEKNMPQTKKINSESINLVQNIFQPLYDKFDLFDLPDNLLFL